MAVYDINGQPITSVYGVNGQSLTQAYDILGNELLEDQPVSDALTVMTYNVQWWSGLNSNVEMQETIIDRYSAQIIGLQELRTSMGTVGEQVLADYPYQVLGVQTNKTGMVSKINLTNTNAGVFATQASETRGWQSATFTYNGKQIFWLNTHLETSSYESVKVAQAQEVFSMVQGKEYFIITGDFNTVCKSVNDTEYTTIMKQFIDAGYHSANCSQQHGFINTWTSGSTLAGTWYPCDHIITSANITIDSVTADTTKIDVAAQTGQSIDHILLIAEVTIS